MTKEVVQFHFFYNETMNLFVYNSILWALNHRMKFLSINYLTILIDCYINIL